jgi:hypothetical protein
MIPFLSRNVKIEMEDSEDGLAIKNGEQFNETFIAVLFENSEKFEIHETPDGTFIHTNDVAAELKLAKIMETNFPDSLDDVEDLVQKRLEETDEDMAHFFDMMVIRSGVQISDFRWSLSVHNSAKVIALSAIGELRGVPELSGKGLPCKKCGDTSTITRPIQTSSGDEPTKLEIRCLACQSSVIVG